MRREVARVPFHGMDILTIKESDEIYVAMKDVCNGLGVDWSAQRQRIMRHEVLSTCVVKITTQVLGDHQPRDILVLPIDLLQGWIFGTKKPPVSGAKSLTNLQ